MLSAELGAARSSHRKSENTWCGERAVLVRKLQFLEKYGSLRKDFVFKPRYPGMALWREHIQSTELRREEQGEQEEGGSKVR